MAKKKTAKKVAKKTVKKTVKKAVRKTKKVSTPKKTKKTKTIKESSKKTKKKILVIAPDEQCFLVNYGPALNSMLELRDVLREITDEQFQHHVNKTKNDFAVWVENILEDKKAATKIKKAKTLNTMIKAVEKALKEYRY